MTPYWGILVVIVLLGCCCYDIEAKRKKKSKRDPCWVITSQQQNLRVRCRKNEMLLDVQILAADTQTGKCSAVKTCTGLQKSSLVEGYNCIGENQCVLSFSDNTPIIKSSDLTCVGRTPDVIEVRGSCSKRNVKNETVYSMTGKEIKHSEGILYSHDIYPWHYPRIGMSSIVSLVRAKRGSKLYVTAYKVDLDTVSPDNLTLTDENGPKHLVQEPNRNQVFTGESVTLHFNVGQRTRGAEGFLLCYKWHTSPIRGSVCKKLIRKAKVSSKKPRRKKGKGKKKKNRG